VSEVSTDGVAIVLVLRAIDRDLDRSSRREKKEVVRQEFFQDSAGPPDPSNPGRRTLRETPADAENYNLFAAIEMTISAGSRLGPYEILAPIGAGGMGEVYRALDPKLKREVAIKVLPDSLARDEDALARFEREALAVAALSHPNILSIFDFGTQDGVSYAVMELLEGETLRLKLVAGALAPRKAADYGAQIARGLAAAHEKGIVHRDLKPENLFVGKDGHVKILDFGLARQIAPLGDPGDTKSPTLARPTEPGVILGTVAYMSPEQVRGLPADHRADIFTFGCVLYEMLSGRRPFSGPSTVETMHAIVRDEPAELPAAVREAAGGLERVLRTCLAKEPGERWQSAADLARELSWLGEDQRRDRASAPAARRFSMFSARWLPWVIAGLAAAAAIFVALFSPRSVVPGGGEPVIRFSVQPPEKTAFERFVLGFSFAPSPDGRRIAFLAASGGPAVLWLWSVSDAAATRLADTESAISPFWAPDGLFVAFFADGKLKKIAVSGGPAQVLCEAPFGQAGTWNAHGVILFSQWSGEGQGIYRISADGGTAAKLALADGAAAGTTRAWPSFLPDGNHFLYMTGVFRGLIEDHRVCVGQLGSREAACLMQSDSRVEYAPPGRLLFVRKGTLLAQPFDAGKRRLSGQPASIADRISVFAPTGGADFGASADGQMLVYRQGAPASRLVWMDRSGRQLGSVGEPGYFGLVRISPDERRLAADVEDPATGGRDIWLYDLVTGLGSRLTFDPVDAGWPVWSPDGSRLAFGSGGKGPPDIYLKELGGQMAETLVLAAPGSQVLADWTRDGRFLAYVDYSPSRTPQRQVWLLPMTGERKPVPLVGNRFSDYDPRFSPDSRFVAFVSEESGQAEVYVAAVDGSERKQRVSPAGGSLPCWSKDGKELFFVAADNVLMTAPVSLERDLRFSAPKPLFSLPPFPFRSDYDVSRDGQRFLVNLGQERARQPALTAIHNWQRRIESTPSP
jgi:serine/threonine protein kinase/Tol biopolymer transport system component